MNYANVKYNDIANGPGVRVSLFVSGCTHHCEGCFNREAWDFDYGQPYTQEVEDAIFEAVGRDYIAGLSLLGGEPFEFVNQKAILPLVRRVKEAYPDKTIWCYSGYTYDKDIMGDMYKKFPVTQELVPLIDVLVDGEFVMSLSDLKLRFRGSSNQRIIDLNKTREAGEIVLWEDTSNLYKK